MNRIDLDIVAPETGTAVGRVAVVAHRGKTFGPGLDELRRRLAAGPWAEHLRWSEVDKSRKVPSRVHDAIEAGATRLIVWGGDGTVQRAVDALHGTDPEKVSVGVMPAGTANLFATNLGIPKTFDEALAVALGSCTRRVDVGRVNGESFVVMAGTGLDALMIHDASRGLKDRVGRLGYVWTGAKHIHDAATEVVVRVDGVDWFEGKASCVLIGNVGTLIGGLQVFENADPSDGLLEVGVVSAESMVEWARLFGRALVGKPSHSPLLTCTQARKVDVALSAKQPYELDGGDRPPAKKLKLRLERLALNVCVP
jgi:diacylglycerol kinase (ATP)